MTRGVGKMSRLSTEPWFRLDDSEIDTIDSERINLLLLQVQQEEADDHDLPGPRFAATYIECDWFDDASLETRYQQMCNYQGWLYHPLLSRPRVEDAG